MTQKIGLISSAAIYLFVAACGARGFHNASATSAVTSLGGPAAVQADSPGQPSANGVSGGLRPAQDACLSEALSSLIVHAHGDEVVVSGTVPLDRCLTQALGADGQAVEVQSATETVRFYLEVRCTGLDLTRLDGKTYGAVQALGETPCGEAKEARVLSEVEDVQWARLKHTSDSGVIVSEEGRRLLTGSYQESGSGCLYSLAPGIPTEPGSQARLHKGDCIDVTRDTITRSRSVRDGVTTIGPDEGRDDEVRRVRKGGQEQVTQSHRVVTGDQDPSSAP